jgi:tetratricopeptide (TPR) repeat protein
MSTIARESTIDKAYKSAERYLKQSNLPAAIDAYKRIAEINSGDLTLINLIGDLSVRVGRIDDAIRYFQAVAEGYREKGFLQPAIAMNKKIYKLAPDKPETYIRLAQLYFDHGQINEAQQWYLSLVELYRGRGEIRSVLDIYELIADMTPHEPRIWLKIAECCVDLGKNGSAHDAFLKAGRAFSSERRFDEAINSYKNALQVKPDSRMALKLLSDRLVQDGRADEAISLLNSMLDREPLEMDIIVILGLAYLEIGMLVEAERTFNRMLQLDPARCGYMLELVRRFFESGDFERGLKIVARNLDKFVENRLAEKALSLVKTTLVNDPNNLSALECLASIYRKQGDPLFLTNTLNSIVDLSLEQGLTDKAADYLKELIEIDPSNLSYSMRLSCLRGENQSTDLFLLSSITGSLELSDPVINIVDVKPGIADAPVNKILSVEPSFDTYEIDLSQIDIINQSYIINQSELHPISEPSGRETPDFSNCIGSYGPLLEREWLRAMRIKTPISLVLLKLVFNDSNLLTEKWISRAVDLVKSELRRAGDFVTSDGSLICLILPATHASGAVLKAESFCSNIEDEFYRAGISIRQYCGISTATPERNSRYSALADAASQALSKAVISGSKIEVLDNTCLSSALDIQL